MRAELANLRDCAVLFLGRATVSLCLYYYTVRPLLSAPLSACACTTIQSDLYYPRHCQLVLVLLYSQTPIIRATVSLCLYYYTVRPLLTAPLSACACTTIQSDLYYPRNSIIRGFWGHILVRPAYMKNISTSMIRTSIIRGFWDQNLVRPSTADNRGLTVIYPILLYCNLIIFHKENKCIRKLDDLREA